MFVVLQAFQILRVMSSFLIIPKNGVNFLNNSLKNYFILRKIMLTKILFALLCFCTITRYFLEGFDSCVFKIQVLYVFFPFDHSENLDSCLWLMFEVRVFFSLLRFFNSALFCLGLFFFLLLLPWKPFMLSVFVCM